MRTQLALVAATIGTLAGCSTADLPDASHSVSLLVVNMGCQFATCDSLTILAFPSIFPIIPAGRWRLTLGTFTTEIACLQIPASAQFNVSGEITRWNSGLGLSLAAVAPRNNGWQVNPSTAAFRPDTASGWMVTFPGGELTPTAPCKPDGSGAGGGSR